MLKTRRKFRRFDLSIGVKFKPTYGAKDYCSGLTTNLSCEGLGLEADDFKFIMYENLELLVELPGEGPVSLFGDIVWKKQNGKKCSAGIKFRMKDKGMQEEAIRKIFSYSNIPAHNMFDSDPDYIINEDAVSEQAGPPEPPCKLGFIKQYHEGGKKCKVTFRLLRETAKNPQSVTLVGDFNNWDVSISPMTRLANGDFVITLDLDSRRTYRFKYLIDGQRWENDIYADIFIRNNYGSKDSVVIV
jgi:hypothetical protein